MARQQNQWILASDIDNTLTGDEEALKRLSTKLQEQMERGNLVLVLSTGRRLEQIMDGFVNENIPEPHGIVSQVGTEIFTPPFHPETTPLAEWDKKLKKSFSRQQALSFLKDIDGLEMQPEEFNTPLKVSCYLDKTPSPEEAVQEIRQRVAPYGDAYQVVWSSSRDLDIIPAEAGKGKAIQFLTQYLGLVSDNVVVAGDSGNDSSMFETFEKGIVVGNAKEELIEAEKDRENSSVYFATKEYAAGVEEGLLHFGVLGDSKIVK